MLLEPKPSLTYGPVNSRRLGSSLGINLFPGKRKICSFDCIYCQYGLRKAISPNVIVPGLPAVTEVVNAIRRHLDVLSDPPAYLTFSGNGEATLHPWFNDLVNAVIELKNTTIPTTKTAILSNSSTVHRSEIRDALSRLDVAIMKFDVGNEIIFQRYNQPAPDVKFDSTIRGLTKLTNVTIQTLMTGGPLGNSSPDNVDSWISCLDIIQPVIVQLYSLDRNPPSSEIEKLTEDGLEDIAERARIRGHRVTVFARS